MWEGNLVQFICLLSVKANNQGDLQKMYSLLVRVVDDKQVVQRLVKCKDYEEFIEVFMKILDKRSPREGFFFYLNVQT